MGDLNCKIGKMIEGNNEEVSKGGKILLAMCKKQEVVILNADKCCDGKWTRIQKEKKSILDYIITTEEDESMNMMIDEDKGNTPYYLNLEKDIVYSDHCMMTVNTKALIDDKKEERGKYITAEGYKKYEEILKSKQVSTIIDEENFAQTYTQWSEMIMQTVDECSIKRKKSKGWKVNRKLMAAKKDIMRELRKPGIDKENIRISKLRKNLIDEYIEEEDRKKKYQTVTKEIDRIKKEGGVDSTAFWELKKRLEGQAQETAHTMENENGEIVEEIEEILDVHSSYFEKLLETRPGETEIEKEAEKIVEITMRAIELLSQTEEAEEPTRDDIKKIIGKLKNKKARDMSLWKNEWIKEGGDEMVESIMKVVRIVDRTYETPEEWNKMKIKCIHKKGPKKKMDNKRGLFITNIVSKVYERLIKERNKNCVKLSPLQTGGVEERSTIDNFMTVLAIIERNTYMGKATYVTFADVEKCFDKLWLEDGITDLWKSGMKTRDCMAIKKLNEIAAAVVDTPVGRTKEIILKNTVRQGTVNGPAICAVSMDTVNKIGYNVVTQYGPKLEIQIVAYVDDLASAGSCTTADNTIKNCSIMEERKKITINTKRGKSALLIVNGNKKKITETVTATVKKGEFIQVDEYKLVGSWLDKSGRFKINIVKRKERLSFMIGSTKRIANSKTMGSLSCSARLNMMDIVLIPSFLYNVEAYARLTKEEEKMLESVQGSILRALLEVPDSTPYLPLLLETGTWTMMGRIHYKRLMLFHHIMNSSEDRLIRKIIKVQEEEQRKGTWYEETSAIVSKYELESINVEETPKSTWKKAVKTKIKAAMEREIREGCSKLKKGRTIQQDCFERKEYLDERSIEESKQITKMRLHMTDVPCNYGQGEVCWLCGVGGVNSEHYFQCVETERLRKCWNIQTSEQMKSDDIIELVNTSKFMQKVAQRNINGKCRSR